MIGVTLCLVSHALGVATIHVDCSRRDATPVPRAFFGQFGEHLGCNVYNGQWAQILRNSSFEAWELFEPEVGAAERWLGLPGIANGRDVGLACYWLPEGEASYALDPENPFNSSLSQRIEVAGRGGIRTPVMLPLHRVRDYEVSFYARADTPTTATVAFHAEDGRKLCAVEARVDGAAWARYGLHLSVAEGVRAGDLCYLVVAFDGPATVWLDHAELFPADHLNGLDPDVVRLVKETRVSLLRFPGGNFVSGYHWRDGIGPREKRVTMRNPAWPIAESNHFGTDEWMAFVNAIGAEPLICVNCGNGTPDEAADWVRYCNEPADGPVGELRAANGHPEPYNVRYWEVGNELWGSWQIGHCSPEEYASRYDAFSKAMRAADANILPIANGGRGNWNARFLDVVEEPIRSLSMHYLVGGMAPKETPAEELAMGLAAHGLEFDRQLERMQDLFRAHGYPDAKVAVTELMSVAPRKGSPGSHCRHAEVLYFAGMMNACIRHRDLVELITRTAVVNHGGGRAKIFEVAFGEPVHFLSMLYGTMSGRWPVACAVDAPGYDSRVAGLPPVENVPVLECVALLDDAGRELTLLVTNRDAREAHVATIRVDGFDPMQTACTRTIAGPPDEINVWNEPPRIRIVSGETEAGNSFEYTFPRCSVTELVLLAAS